MVPFSKIVPIAFWICFLALGFVTSLGGPSKQPASPRDVVAETEPRSGRAAD
ncbi:hypothetical protein [Methylocystis echinoides]|uniref:hypothetical protein n=1 Tax=Methylocystis echinoides TaxID=29468 RepID=UPI00342CD71D